MSMYNLMHGMNPLAGILLKMLEIDQEGSKYSSGRFRDIYLNEDGKKIILFTRNGGGNRETYQETIDILATHPNFITDYDDEFDCTYAYIEFSVPTQYLATTTIMAAGVKPKTLKEKTDDVMAEIKSMKKEDLEKDPRFKLLVNTFK